MSETIDREAYEKMIKRVMGKNFTSRQYATEVVDDILEYQGMLPPRKSTLPEISPAPWMVMKVDHGEGLTCYIIDNAGRGDEVARIYPGYASEGNAALIAAAPDLRSAAVQLLRTFQNNPVYIMPAGSEQPSLHLAALDKLRKAVENTGFKV